MVTRNLPLFFAFAGMALLAACGGSSSGGNNDGGGAAGGGGGGGGGAGAGGGGGTPATEAVTVSLGDAIKNVAVQPNVATQFSIDYSLDPTLLAQPITAYKAFSVNLEDTMPSVQITSSAVADNEEPGMLDPYRLLFRLARHIPLQTLLGIGDAYANTQGTVTVYISYEGDPDACVNGYALGSYNFTGDVDTQATSETGVATTEGMSPAIHLVSTGSFGLCVEISPVPIPMPAFITIPEIAVEAEPCDLDPLPDADLVGDWAGTYSCENKNSPTEGGPISLNISKNTDGTFTYVDDGGASYTGHFCGPEFRYSGGVPGDYTESGKFIVQSGGSAFKESTWNSIPAGFDAGTCTDDLTKQ